VQSSRGRRLCGGAQSAALAHGDAQLIAQLRQRPGSRRPKRFDHVQVAIHYKQVGTVAERADVTETMQDPSSGAPARAGPTAGRGDRYPREVFVKSRLKTLMICPAGAPHPTLCSRLDRVRIVKLRIDDPMAGGT